MSNGFEVPNWACKPPAGLHLDVYKEDKLIQKLMVDEKRCYFFGRNRDLNDICIDHSSCSRVHAALLYHKHVSRSYLIDLGSVHGTFVGNLRLESNKPTPLPVDSSFSFGASTRRYVIRERPQAVPLNDDLETAVDIELTETELVNLTEFNTARNKKLEMVGAVEAKKSAQKRKSRKNVSFNEEEEVINPEDVDPSVGRFRNLVQSAVVPGKKMRLESGMVPPEITQVPKQTSSLSSSLKASPVRQSSSATTFSFTPSGFSLPNPAPDVDNEFNKLQLETPSVKTDVMETSAPKKKYVKESWPGRKPLPDTFLQ